MNDTFPQWLFRRFSPQRVFESWEELSEGDQHFWRHEADAVRRAVARNGFKNPTNQDQKENQTA